VGADFLKGNRRANRELFGPREKNDPVYVDFRPTGWEGCVRCGIKA
jgi:hypothetical protein